MPGNGSARARLLGAQLRDPGQHTVAKRSIIAAFRATGGNAVHAAERLDVSHRILMEWLEQHADLRSEVERIRRSSE